MATFSKNRVFGKLINQYEINGVSYTANTTGSITVDGSGASSIAAAAGTSVYATPNDLPVSGNSEGDQAFVSSNNRLYIWNGSGWYNIALINTNPSISSILDSNDAGGPFVLSTEGIPITITITASDPEGLPITYTAVTDSAFDGIATLTQDSSIFTVTPLSLDSSIPGTGNVTFRASDGVNIASSIQSFTLSFVNALWKNIALSIGTNSTNGIANQTYVDKSSNAIALSIAGTPTQTAFHPYLENWSVYLDGNDYLYVDNDAEWQFGTGDYTIEFWVNFDTLPASNDTYAAIVGYYHSSNANWFVQVRNVTGQLKIGVLNSLFDYNFLTNTWYHVALTRQSGFLKAWVNGQYLGSLSDTVNIGNNNVQLKIGVIQSTASSSLLGYMKGHLSNLSITKGTALYSGTSNITVPTESTQSASRNFLTCQTNRFIDTSSNNYTVVPVGNPKISSYNPYGQESEYATGQNKGSVQIDTGEMVSGTGIADMAVGTGAFTYEAWVYTPNFSYDNGGGIIYSQAQSGQNYLMLTINTSGQPSITYGDGGGTGITASSAIKLNTWNHVAWVRENTGTDGFKIYLNGEVAATGTVAYNFSSTTMGFAFGRYPHTTLVQYNGYISDFKYTKSAVYTAAFTPPTAPLGNTNATMYVPFDNAGAFDRTSNDTVQLLGNAVTSTTQTKYASTSIHLTATSDYIKIDNTGNRFAIPASTDFTIEFWLYPLADTASGNVLATHGWPNYGAWLIYTTGSGYQFYASTNNASWDIANAQNMGWSYWTNEWKHCAIVRSGSSINFYLNGVQTGVTVTSSAAFYSATDIPITIGANKTGGSGHQPFYIEDFQFLKGVAKYTGNFTPPTGSQGRTYQAES